MQESEFVHLGREDVPEWFTLDLVYGVDPTVLPLPLPPVPLLILGIAEGMLRHIVDILPKYSWLDGCRKRLEEYEIATTDFLFDTSKPWGFRGVLNPYERPGHTGIREYAIPIPQIEKDGGECESCEGTGKTDDGWDCIHCNTTGRETAHDWDTLDCIAATLCVLGSILEMPAKEWLVGNTTRRQLLTVQMNFERGRAFIGATLSRSFGDYVRSLSNQELPKAKEAIKNVYLQMFPSHRRFGDFHFQANVHRNGQLILSVPGDACSLAVDGFSNSLREASGPLKLNCHNVDGHHQQLTLLSGLAALSGMARKRLPDM